MLAEDGRYGGQGSFTYRMQDVDNVSFGDINGCSRPDAVGFSGKSPKGRFIVFT